MTGKRGEGRKKKLEAQRPLVETGEVTRVGVAEPQSSSEECSFCVPGLHWMMESKDAITGDEVFRINDEDTRYLYVPSPLW